MFTIYSTSTCIWCSKAKNLLETLGYEYDEIVLDTPEKKQTFLDQGHTTVPQIYRKGLLIGGYSDLIDIIKEKLKWN